MIDYKDYLYEEVNEPFPEGVSGLVIEVNKSTEKEKRDAGKMISFITGYVFALNHVQGRNTGVSFSGLYLKVSTVIEETPGPNGIPLWTKELESPCLCRKKLSKLEEWHLGKVIQQICDLEWTTVKCYDTLQLPEKSSENNLN